MYYALDVYCEGCVMWFAGNESRQWHQGSELSTEELFDGRKAAGREGGNNDDVESTFGIVYCAHNKWFIDSFISIVRCPH